MMRANDADCFVPLRGTMVLEFDTHRLPHP
jgi:hypothetical protein